MRFDPTLPLFFPSMVPTLAMALEHVGNFVWERGNDHEHRSSSVLFGGNLRHFYRGLLFCRRQSENAQAFL